jgi:hypothetical protein
MQDDPICRHGHSRVSWQTRARASQTDRKTCLRMSPSPQPRSTSTTLTSAMDDQQGIVIEQPYYPPPHSYDFSRPDPPVIVDYDPRLESELGEGNFLRDARWYAPQPAGLYMDNQGTYKLTVTFGSTLHRSPDGSSLLTVGEDRTIRTFSMYFSSLFIDVYAVRLLTNVIRICPSPRCRPHELLSLSLASAPPALPSTDQTFTPNLTLPQQSAIYSTLWYPSASLAMEGSFCFLAAGEGTTIRLIDGVDGRIRASYPIIDHRERFVAPHSMAFNLDASKSVFSFSSASDRSSSPQAEIPSHLYLIRA